MEKVINVNNVDIPFVIKTIKRAKSVKMFIRDNILVVTKPFYVSKIKVEKIILENNKKQGFLSTRDFIELSQELSSREKELLDKLNKLN